MDYCATICFSILSVSNPGVDRPSVCFIPSQPCPSLVRACVLSPAASNGPCLR